MNVMNKNNLYTIAYIRIERFVLVFRKSVNFIKPYSVVRKSNILGLHEIIKFAAAGKLKSISSKNYNHEKLEGSLN
jgi:hypothetical protein